MKLILYLRGVGKEEQVISLTCELFIVGRVALPPSPPTLQ